MISCPEGPFQVLENQRRINEQATISGVEVRKPLANSLDSMVVVELHAGRVSGVLPDPVSPSRGPKGVEIFPTRLGAQLELRPCWAKLNLFGTVQMEATCKHGKPPFMTCEVVRLDFGGEEKWQVTAY